MEAIYLENEGCSDDVVHPKRHCGQERLVRSMCLGLVYSIMYSIMASVVDVAGR